MQRCVVNECTFGMFIKLICWMNMVVKKEMVENVMAAVKDGMHGWGSRK